MKTILSSLFLFFCLQGFTQFSLHTVMPLNVSGVAFGDTLLNTAAILQAQGIKKIKVLETKSNTPSYWIREYTITDGLVVANRSCYRRSRDNDSGFCIARDTLVYDTKRRLKDYWAGPTKDSAYIQCSLQYLPDGTIASTWMAKDPRRTTPYIDVYHYQRNEKGQLISAKTISGENPVNARLYYNEDGFLDSVRNDNPAHGVYVFIRKKKGKDKEITADAPNSSYRWIYNVEGQCLSSYWSVKPQPAASGRARPLFANISYSYNDDGTLAKVVEKSSNSTTTVVYSYTR